MLCTHHPSLDLTLYPPSPVQYMYMYMLKMCVLCYIPPSQVISTNITLEHIMLRTYHPSLVIPTSAVCAEHVWDYASYMLIL